MKKIIWHGSPEIIEKPIFGVGKKQNDYGRGFYCTEVLELAKEWACKQNKNGFINRYELDLTDLKSSEMNTAKKLMKPLKLLTKKKQMRK